MSRAWVLYDIQLYITSIYIFQDALNNYFIHFLSGYSYYILILLTFLLSNTILLAYSLFRSVSRILPFSLLLSSAYSIPIFYYDILTIYNGVYRDPFNLIPYIYHLILTLSPLFHREIRTLYSVSYLDPFILASPILPASVYLVNLLDPRLQPSLNIWMRVLESLYEPRNIMALGLSITLLTAYYIRGYIPVKRIRSRYGIEVDKRLWIPRVYSYPSIKLTYPDGCIFYVRSYGYGFQIFTRLRILKASIYLDKLKMLLSTIARMSIVYDYDGLIYLILYTENPLLYPGLNSLIDVLSRFRDGMLVYRFADEPGYRYKLSKATEYMEIYRLNADSILDSRSLMDRVYVFKLLQVSNRKTDSDSIVGVGVYNIEGYGDGDIHDIEVYEYTRASEVYSLVNRLLKSAQPISLTESSPLKYRVDRIYFDGSTRPDVSIDIPIDRHIGLFGCTGMGKSTALADLIEYIIDRSYRCIVFDWISNFTSLENAKILYPGINTSLDIYRYFSRKTILELYRELSLLRYGLDGLFTPNVENILLNTLKEVNSHSELLDRLKDLMNHSKDKDLKTGAYAAYRRIRLLDPRLYEPGLRDLTSYLNEYNLIIVDLSILDDSDKILFTLASLKAIYDYYTGPRKQDDRLYIVIDEVHRIAPEYNVNHEYIIERIIREGRKYNIQLLIADQAISAIKQTLYTNIPTKFVFNLGDPHEIRYIINMFTPLAEEHDGEIARYITSKILDLKPGECYMISSYREEPYKPIPCYFLKKEIRLHSWNIDLFRFREITSRFKYPDNMAPNDREKSIENARNLIIKYGDKILNPIIEAIENNRRLKIDGVRLVRDGKPTVTTQIILRYFGYNKLYHSNILYEEGASTYL